MCYYSVVTINYPASGTMTLLPKQVDHIAHLANIPTTQGERERLAHEFSDTLQVVDQLRQVDVSDVEPTHQVTGLENVWREDVVEESRMFTQEEALSNATHTHNGFFVVNRILEEAN